MSEWAKYNKEKNNGNDKYMENDEDNSSDEQFNSGDEFYKKKSFTDVHSFLSNDKGPIVKLELDKIENEMSLK